MELPHASLLRRILSLIIDVFPIALLFFYLDLFYNLGANFQYKNGESISILVFKNPQNVLLFFSVMIFYLSVSQKVFGKSLGELVFKIRTVSKNIHSLTFYQAFLKNLLLPLDIFLVGLVSILLSEYHQTLGDRIANTVVVKKNRTYEENLTVKITRWKKMLAALLIIFLLSFSYGVLKSIPKIWEVNRVSRSFLKEIEVGLQINNLQNAYKQIASFAKQQLSFDDFKRGFEEQKVVQTSIKGHQEVNFHQWIFLNNRAILKGNIDNRTSLELQLVLENNTWKVNYYVFQVQK